MRLRRFEDQRFYLKYAFWTSLKHFKAEQIQGVMVTFWKPSFPKSRGHLAEIFKSMNKNTINEGKKTDIGTGVQMSKYFNQNSPASQGNETVYFGYARCLVRVQVRRI